MVDEVASSSGTNVRTSSPVIPPADDFDSDDPEILVLQMVRHDPFATIRELKNEVNIRSTRVYVGWWEVFGILRRNGMLRRRARFRFARQRL